LHRRRREKKKKCPEKEENEEFCKNKSNKTSFNVEKSSARFLLATKTTNLEELKET
jgi:hypothetical protein